MLSQRNAARPLQNRIRINIALCYQSAALMEYNNTLRSILGEVTNMAVVSDVMTRKQASLPVKLGGLDVRSAVEVASSAYLASLCAASALVEVILPATFTTSKPS